MKSKWNLFVAIFQLIVGILAIIAFLVLGINGEDLTKWIITLLLAIGYVILGILGVIDHPSDQ